MYVYAPLKPLALFPDILYGVNKGEFMKNLPIFRLFSCVVVLCADLARNLLG